MRALDASDAPDAGEMTVGVLARVDMWRSLVRLTRAARLSLKRHTRLSLARVFQPSDGITAIFVCGLINTSGGQLWQQLGTLRT
jgi:hypothetical protein